MAERLASALVGELLALSDDDLRPLADRLAPSSRWPSPPAPFSAFDQAAERLGIHPSTVYRMIVGGRLRAVRAGRLWRIPGAELGRVESTGQAPARPPALRPSPRTSRRFGDLVRELPYAEPP